MDDGKLILTGQLGDGMKKSALSLVKSRAEAMGISPDIFRKNEFLRTADGALELCLEPAVPGGFSPVIDSRLVRSLDEINYRSR